MYKENLGAVVLIFLSTAVPVDTECNTLAMTRIAVHQERGSLYWEKNMDK